MHEETYKRDPELKRRFDMWTAFMRYTTYGTVLVALVLIAMAVFLV